MGTATEQAIADLRAGPGELSFEARIGGEAKRVWFRTETAVTPPADAALAACLMPAMRFGGSLRMADPVSPRLLRVQREFQGVQRAWSLAREFGQPPLLEVEVEAPRRELPPREPTGRVAAFFSGGVDSWSTVLDNPDLTDLIFVRGVDLLPHATHQEGLADEVEARLREVAVELGLDLHAIETNVRELADPVIAWEAYFACPLIAVALFFEPIFDRVLIAGDVDYEVQGPRGANRFVCRLLSTEWIEVADDGGRLSRMDRVRRIAAHPLVQRSLRVCWENPGGAYNCGRCAKCLLAMAALEVTGYLDRFETFPHEIDREALVSEPIFQAVSVQLREEVLEAAEESGSDLAGPLRELIARGRAELGMSSGPPLRPPRPALDPEYPAGTQAIANLRAGPGELSFEARIGGEAKRVWFRTETAVTPPADAALAACLMPAMRFGGSLRMEDPVSPRVLRGQREFGAVQAAWSRTWELPGGPLHEVEVTAPTRAVEPREPTGRVAAFFSGGVDSFAAVAEEGDVTDLIFVRGVDLLPAHAGHAAVVDEGEARVREAAAALGLTLHVVETNVRELSDGLAPWEAYFACPLIAVALFFEPIFDRVLIAGDVDYELQEHLPYGAIWTIEQLWSSERVEIVEWGGRMSREQRKRIAAESPIAQRLLRVCWENPDGAYNCGRCRKCVQTMLSFEAWGVSGLMETFPPLDLTRIEEFELDQKVVMVIWEDLLATVRAAGRPDLIGPVQHVVERSRAATGAGAGFRARALATPGPEPAPAPGEGQLFADPATADELAAGSAVALLVGSYDGSGNFGDIAQLEGALGALAPLGDRLLALPVLELGAADRYRDPAHAPRGAERVLYFDPSGRGEPGLTRLRARVGPGLGVCWLYGGGYLNGLWGARKLAMLGACEALLGGAGGIVRLASGLQVDAGWMESLPLESQQMLRRFDLLGSRDPESTATLAALGGDSTLVETGDEALAAFARLRPPRTADGEEQPSVNLHFADHDWVTEDPGRLGAFVADLLAALARRGVATRFRPLLAYADSVTDERAALRRLADRCGAGIELLEPRLLRTAGLEELAHDLGRARLTISCSYHVSLVSLMLGAPTVLLADNPYYQQKAAGLRAGFDLPAELGAASREDPEAVAGRIASFAGPGAQAVRARIAAAGERMRTRRARAEAALFTHLSGFALERTAHLGAELATISGSRSWQLTEPLRRGAARARQRRRGPGEA